MTTNKTKQTQVLLVEDEPLDAQLVQLAVATDLSLHTHAFEFHHCQTLAAAAAVADQRPFDLVLLDLGLPSSTGIETLQAWQKLHPELPVVVLTGLGDGQVAAQAIKHGAQDYLVKNEWEGGIVRAMCYALERAAVLREIREKEQLLRDAREAQKEAEVRAAMIDELEAARNAAESGSQAKSEFMANISHELRTPLHAILGYSQLALKNGADFKPGKMSKYWSRIEKSGELLLSLVNNLLDVSKLEAGADILDLQPVDINLQAEIVAAEFQAVAEQKKIEIQLEGCENGIAVVDASRIDQVIRNLISNAIKFSPEGSRVIVSTQREQKQLRLQVADNGPGVPASEQQAIFDKFIQSSRTRTGAGGTGLGLAICRGIIDLHGGEIRVEENPQGGSCFVVELPTEVINEKAATSAATPPVEPQICT